MPKLVAALLVSSLVTGCGAGYNFGYGESLFGALALIPILVAITIQPHLSTRSTIFLNSHYWWICSLLFLIFAEYKDYHDLEVIGYAVAGAFGGFLGGTTFNKKGNHSSENEPSLPNNSVANSNSINKIQSDIDSQSQEKTAHINPRRNISIHPQAPVEKNTINQNINPPEIKIIRDAKSIPAINKTPAHESDDYYQELEELLLAQLNHDSNSIQNTLDPITNQGTPEISHSLFDTGKSKSSFKESDKPSPPNASNNDKKSWKKTRYGLINDALQYYIPSDHYIEVSSPNHGFKIIQAGYGRKWIPLSDVNVSEHESDELPEFMSRQLLGMQSNMALPNWRIIDGGLENAASGEKIPSTHFIKMAGRNPGYKIIRPDYGISWISSDDVI